MNFDEIYNEFVCWALPRQRTTMQNLRQQYGEENFMDAFMGAYQAVFCRAGLTVCATDRYEGFMGYTRRILEGQALGVVEDALGHAINAVDLMYRALCRRTEIEAGLRDYVIACQQNGMAEEEIAMDLDGLRQYVYRLNSYDDWIGMVRQRTRELQ